MGFGLVQGWQTGKVRAILREVVDNVRPLAYGEVGLSTPQSPCLPHGHRRYAEGKITVIDLRPVNGGRSGRATSGLSKT
jgi:hypothetical protein